MSRKSLPEPPLRLPIELRPVSNGEFEPAPPSPGLVAFERRVLERAFHCAKRSGLSRRQFLNSSAGAACVLLSLNELGCGGGRYALAQSSAVDGPQAEAELAGNEFIFDVQTHRVSTTRDWHEKNWQFRSFGSRSEQGKCGESDWRQCYSSDRYVRAIFLESDTSMAVMSSLPGYGDANPLTVEEAEETREIVAKLEGAPRLLLHAIVQPNIGPLQAELERMQRLAQDFSIAAWKLYTVWGSEGRGYFLDDPATGIPVIEQAQKLGVPFVAVHKGLPQAGMDPNFTRPHDVGVVAKRFPSVKFLIYHSGFEHDRTEGPYDESAERGVDALIRSLQEHGVGKNENVYAEMGAVWHALMKKPDEAAHFLGKLLVHVGEDRILWGTDCIWFGSPQEQIRAFRAFEVSPEYQERYGYPALTAERKAKILGLNAARLYGVDVEQARSAQACDALARVKLEYAARGRPRSSSYGPRTRRQYLRGLAAEGKLPRRAGGG